MQRIVFAALGLVVAGACTKDVHGPADPGDGLPGDGDPTTAFAVNCSSCHGSSGQGTDDAPQIQNPVHAYATYVIRNGRAESMGFGGDMPPFGAGDDVLSDADLAGIFAVLDAAPHPTDGAGLYVRFCGNCHGADARGGRTHKSILDETDDVSEKVRSGHGGTAFAQAGKYMPKWATGDLSNAEVQLITGYLQTMGGGGGGGDDDDDDLAAAVTR